jgi:hypothetical protein
VSDLGQFAKRSDAMIEAVVRSSLLALILTVCWSPAVSAQFGSSAEHDDASAGMGASSQSAQPAAVAMEVWVVTLRKPRDVNEEDRFGKVLKEAANLPADLGDRGDVGKLLDQWEALGAVRRLEHFRATSRSGQGVLVVPTEQAPMIVGTSITQFGKTNNIQLRQIGTSLKLKPKVVGEHGIDVDVEYENTELFDSESVNLAELKDGDPEPAVGTKGASIQSVVPVANGHAMLVTLVNDSAQQSPRLVVVAAELLEE